MLRYGDGHTEKRGATVAGDRARARDGRSVRPAGPFKRCRRRIRSWACPGCRRSARVPPRFARVALDTSRVPTTRRLGASVRARARVPS